jgi:hypothetical protein
MKAWIVMIMSVCALSLSSQNSKVAELIKGLDNSQFVINHNEKAKFEVKSAPANKLIRKGKKASAQLIAALDNPDKVIMAHYALCHIYFKHVSFAGPKIVSDGEADIYKYFLGQEKGEGLIISEAKKGGNYRMYVEDKDVQKIKEYWKKRNA